MPLLTLDTILTRVPLVRWLAWNIVMWGEKPGDLDVEGKQP
jgi:hypothetical protein